MSLLGLGLRGLGIRLRLSLRVMVQGLGGLSRCLNFISSPTSPLYTNYWPKFPPDLGQHIWQLNTLKVLKHKVKL